ncbi:MAG: MFS transporter [Actinomycetota bacterium]
MPKLLENLLPELPPIAWRIIRADIVSALGTGLVLPFLVVYFRDARGFSVVVAAFAVSVMAVSGLIVGLLAGALVDRIGSRSTLLVALLVSSAGSILLAFVTQPWQAFVAAGILGAGTGGMWPATNSLFVTIVPPEKSSRIFAVHYASLNLGIGLGGILGGLVADVTRPGTFQALYIFDGLSWIFFAVVLLRMKNVGGKPEAERDDPAVKGGYRALLKDPVYLRLLLVMSLFVTLGYAQLQSGFPAFATAEGGISTRALGAAFAANTFLIVIAQLVVLKRLEGRRRTRALLGVCGLWAVAWTITVLVPEFDSNLQRAFGFALAMGIFGLGECLISPTVPAIINSLAPPTLRGRYNAGYSFTFAIGEIIGPAMAGLMLGAGLGTELFLVLIGSCGLAALVIVGLERRLPESANRGLPHEVVARDDRPVLPA